MMFSDFVRLAVFFPGHNRSCDGDRSCHGCIWWRRARICARQSPFGHLDLSATYLQRLAAQSNFAVHFVERYVLLTLQTEFNEPGHYP
jgi:hypothetical protein